MVTAQCTSDRTPVSMSYMSDQTSNNGSAEAQPASPLLVVPVPVVDRVRHDFVHKARMYRLNADDPHLSESDRRTYSTLASHYTYMAQQLEV